MENGGVFFVKYIIHKIQIHRTMFYNIDLLDLFTNV